MIKLDIKVKYGEDIKKYDPDKNFSNTGRFDMTLTCDLER